MFCGNCGMKIKEDAVFCVECGTKIKVKVGVSANPIQEVQIEAIEERPAKVLEINQEPESGDFEYQDPVKNIVSLKEDFTIRQYIKLSVIQVVALAIYVVSVLLMFKSETIVLNPIPYCAVVLVMIIAIDTFICIKFMHFLK